MRARLSLLGALAVLAFCATEAKAADAPLAISGSIRLRYEGLDGQFRPGANAEEGVVGLRTSVLAEYDPGPWRVGAELYDSRVYGADRQSPISANDVNAFELVQAYVGARFHTPAGAIDAQLGRMTMNLGARRLVALNGYRNTTNGFTGLRLDHTSAQGVSTTLFYTLPQIRSPSDIGSLLENRAHVDRETFDLRFYGGLVSGSLPGGLHGDAGVYRLTERDSPKLATRNRRLTTLSARLTRAPAPDAWDFEVEGAYQVGGIRASAAATAAALDVSAYFAHLEVGYQFPGPWRARVSAEYEIASGDGPKARYGRFDTLYGARRADFGPSGIYALLGRANISSPGLRLEATPGARVETFVALRLLWAASATDAFSTSGVVDSSGKSGTYAGEHLEGRLQYWLFKDRLRVDLNGAVLFKGRLLKSAPNALRTGDAHYVSTALVASF